MINFTGPPPSFAPLGSRCFLNNDNNKQAITIIYYIPLSFLLLIAITIATVPYNSRNVRQKKKENHETQSDDNNDDDDVKTMKKGWIPLS